MVSAAASIAAGVLALVAATAGASLAAGALLLVMDGLLADGRRWLRLAGRSRVGARSEDEVQQALARLEAEGWRLRHSLPRRGRGDIDSVAIAPTGVAFVIDTKTRTYDGRHLARGREQAARPWRRRRRWCKHGALPVVCLARRSGVEHVEAGVLVVSIDRLAAALRTSAGLRHRPGFPALKATGCPG
jgi:Nuclease-related domain